MTIMHFNKKLLVPICLLSGSILLASMTLIREAPKQQEKEDPKLMNIKVLSKKLTYRQVDHIMDQWAAALGVRCNFCHARNDETKKMDFPSDAKPEKKMAREMFLMSEKINKKYFKADKDSVGMVKLSSVNCYTCHRGVAHLEEATWPKRGGGPGGPPPGGPGMGGPGMGGPGMPPPGGPMPEKKP